MMELDDAIVNRFEWRWRLSYGLSFGVVASGEGEGIVGVSFGSGTM